eukprot:sb/3463429/
MIFLLFLIWAAVPGGPSSLLCLGRPCCLHNPFHTYTPVSCKCNHLRCDTSQTCTSKIGECYLDIIIREYNCSLFQPPQISKYEEGCIGAEVLFHLCQGKLHVGHEVIIQCCNKTMCNTNQTSFLKIVNNKINNNRQATNNGIWWLVVGALSMLGVVMLGGALYRAFKCRRFRKAMGIKDPYITLEQKELPVYPTDPHPQYFSDMSLSNTSGAGRTQFVQRTISKQAQLIELVGKGRYGEVWKALWRGDPVAIKQFDPRDEQSWMQEVKMYETSWLRHENILGYMGSDCKSTASSTRWWIMMDYCQHGSLYEYLYTAKYTPLQLLEALRGIYSGLEHLHTSMYGNNPDSSKPSIAHRDLKTHNILVKSPTHCCIGDLGMAITYSDYKEKVNKNNFQVGTRRYMAPEIITGTANLDNFASFLAADMFSSAYIIWEMLHVTLIDSEVDRERTLPFIEDVPNNPSVEDMKKVVVDEQQRPPIPALWKRSPISRELCGIMKELWYEEPGARLTCESQFFWGTKEQTRSFTAIIHPEQLYINVPAHKIKHISLSAHAMYKTSSRSLSPAPIVYHLSF